MSKVHVVGGLGYIGIPLCKELHDLGYDVHVYDIDIHGSAEFAKDWATVHQWDMRQGPIVSDGNPVVWLASQHMEPSFDDGNYDDGRWIVYSNEMFSALQALVMDKGQVIYTSSAQVLSGWSIYANHKRRIEKLMCGEKSCRVLRFGTVFGGLHRTPSRPQTVPNRVLSTLGEWLPDTNYLANLTHIDLAVDSLVRAVQRPGGGTVENVFSTREQRGREWFVEAIKGIETLDSHRAFRTELQVCRNYPSLMQDLQGLTHPTKLLAEKVGLPYPELP